MRSYIYSDLDQSLDRNLSGNYIIKYDVDSIKQSIKLLLSTVSGERVRNPIGGPLIKLLFQPMNQDTSNAIRTMLAKTINQYEPRVRIVSITVTPNYDLNTYDVRMVISVVKITELVEFETKLRSMNL